MTRWSLGGTLRHARLQQWLAVAAIGTAVALPVVLLSVGGGVSAHELADLENAGYQIVVSAAGEHGVVDAHNFTEQLLGIGSVAAASPVLSVSLDAFNASGGPTPVLAEGVIPGQFLATLGPPEKGLFPSPLPLGDPTDRVHFDNGTYAGPATDDLLVSSPFADAHALAVGDSVVLSPNTNRSLGTAFRITGTFGVPPTALGPTGAFAVMMPLSDLQVLGGLAAGAHGAVVDAADTVEVALAGAASTNPAVLNSVRNEIQSLRPYYGVSSLQQEAQQLEAASSVLTGFYLALSSVALTVGLLFLALVLVRRVEADRRSIGIRRALGLPSSAIASGLIRDGLVLAASGAVVGVVGGYLLVEGLAAWGNAAVQEATRLAVFAPVTLGLVVAGVLLLSLLASGVATRAALRIDITEALR
jgi:hypothetical protein